MGMTRTRRATALMAFLLGLGAAAGAQQPPGQFPPTMPALLQVDHLQERLDAAASDEERYQLLTQLILSLERLRATSEVSEAYERLFQLSPLTSPLTRFQWVARWGNYLEGQARPDQAAQVYERFLQEFEAIPDEAADRYRSELQLRLLSALIQTGDYRRAKPMAFAILDASDSGSPLPLLEPLLELAESDRLTPPELERLSSLLLAQPLAPHLLPRLLRLYVDQGRSQKAVDLLDRLLEQNPALFLAHLDVAYEIYAGFLKEAAGGYVLARLDALAERPPSEPATRLIRVRWLEQVGQGEEAMAFLEQQPKDQPVFQKERASLFFRHGRYDSAAEAYLELLRREPDNLAYHRQLGECFYRQDRRKEAELIWERIPAALGKTFASYLALAEIFQSHRLYLKAVGVLKEALEAPQADPLNLLLRILDLRVEAGDDEALLGEYLDLASRHSAYEASFRARIVEQITTLDRVAGLQEILQRFLAAGREPGEQENLRLLATDLWMSAGEYDRAIEFVRSAYLNASERGLRLYVLGSELSRRGQTDQAIAAWQSISQDNPYFLQAGERMAQLSLRTGRLEPARQTAVDLILAMFRRRGLPAPAIAQGIEAAGLERYLSAFRASEGRTLASALSTLADVDLQQKRPGEALQALLLLESLPQRSRPGRLSLLFGHAYSQLGSLDTAKMHYELALGQALPRSPEETEAGFFLAECLLWQDNSLEALERYLELARSAPQEDFANDALHRYLVVAFAGADQLYHYSLATLFAWKGDGEEAIRLYREAAADEAEGDVAGWCLYEVSRLLVDSGQEEAARRQINHVIERYDYPTLQAECRVLLSRLPGAQPAGLTTEATGPYVDLILRHGDTLYSDLARLKIEGRLDKPF